MADPETDDAAPGKEPKPYDRRAQRSLRFASRVYEQNGWQPSVEAEFHVRQAEVLALMDIAAALREREKGSA